MGKLIVKHNEIEVNEGTSSRNLTFKVGDQIELFCTANVGSISTTLIQWRKTTKIGTADIWNEYQPSAIASSDGQAVRENCGYTRTATMIYNMTNADANRQNNLGFECYVRVSDVPYNNYVTPESLNPKFYADVSCDIGYYGDECNSKCGYCFNNVSCMAVNGSCPEGCAAGYFTDLCNQACPEGYYGQSCYLECGYCKENKTCEPQTGHCELCAEGYTGEFCKVCTEGRYGEGCEHSCGHCADRAPCNKTTGICLTGCTSEYFGDRCIEKTSSQASLSGGAVVAIVVGIITLVVIQQ